MDKDKNKLFKWRAFISVLMAISFIVMAFTGVILFVTPPGRFANWSGWTIIALTKHQWGGLHIWFSLIFVITSAFHIYFNWKLLVSYFKNKVSQAFSLRAEWILALVISVVVFVGTLGNIAPFSSLLEWNETIKRSWEKSSQRAPMPHAELLTFTEFAKQVQGVNLVTILANLKAKGIEVASADADVVVFGELAEASNMTPRQLYDLALGRAGTAGVGHGSQCSDNHDGDGAKQAKGSGSGSGFGRLTLKRYCDSVGLDINASVETLKKAGFEATPEMTIRAIADTAGSHPSAVRTALEPKTQ